MSNKNKELKKIIIAIDGFSGTGKSTIAKGVAQELGYIYVDTGAMYRAVAYLAYQQGLIAVTGVQNSEGRFESHEIIDKKSLLEVLKNSDLSFMTDPISGTSQMHLNGKNIEKEIRSITIANHVSKVAKIPEVRSYLVELQRKMAEKKGVVMDGRDIGTVVFPDAELKIFMTASESIRAQRRYDELLAKGEQVQLHQVLKNIQERDDMDTNRTESPLRKAQDAIELDNSQTTIAQMVKTIVDLARKQIQL